MPTLSPQTTPYYGGGQVLNPSNVIKTSGAPSSKLTEDGLGTIAVDNAAADAYMLVSKSGGVDTWTLIAGASSGLTGLTGDSGTATPSGGTIKVAGTANEITSTAASHTVTLSLPSAITTPGSLTTTTTLTGGTGITATTGDIVATAGEVNAGTTMTAGTGLTVTTGDMAISAGDALVTGNVIASKSDAGANVTVQATNSDNTSGTSNAGVEIASGGASSGDPYLSFQISGVGASTMTMGLDNSASDLFVISNSGSIGTSNALTLSQAGALNATTSITAGTSLTATSGAITATNGNLVLNTAGNKIISTSVGSGTSAGANSFGTVTLASGTATVSTTAVTANSIIMLTRMDVGASTALGFLSIGTIVAGTSFVVYAATQGTPGTPNAADASVVGWMIIN